MRTTPSKRSYLKGASSAVLAAVLFAGPNMALAAACSWDPATGDWSNAGNWSCGAIPGSGDTVSIAGGKSVSIVNEGESTGAMTLSAAAALGLNNSTLNQYGDVLNNGTITVANNSRLQNQLATLNYSGTGTIVLDDTANAAQIYGGAVTFGSGQTVKGSGQIGLNGTYVVNNGVISASISGRTLDIDVAGGNGGVSGSGVGTGGNAGFYNTNLLQANGSTLQLDGGLYENSSTGVIKAINGGVVVLNGDSRVVGGALTSDASSSISATNNTQYLQSVTLTTGSNLNLSNDTVQVNTALTNNGTITVANNSVLYGETGATSFSGKGTIVLDDSANVARIYNGTITFGAQQTVRGAGEIGINSAIVINNGLITANAGTGIVIDTTGGNGGVGAGNGGVGADGVSSLQNNATMQGDGATLSFNGGRYDNNSGVIQAINKGTVALNGDSRIIGGSLTSDATSSISAANATQYLQSVTLTSGSQLNLINDSLYVNTSLVNNGTITVANNSALLGETGTTSFSGKGTIVLDDSANSARIYNGQITFGGGQTVRGAGQIGINSATIINNGLISADAGTGIDIDATGGNGGLSGAGVGTNGNAGLYNTSIVQAKGTTLAFEGGLYENSGSGVIQAIDGGTVALNGDSRILNGTLTSDATSSISAANTTQYLQTVTITSGSQLNLTNDSLYVNTSLVNNGTITVANNSALLGETGATSFSGKGTIVLDDSGNVARIYNGQITFGSGQTVRGAGQLGINSATIVNNGLISADAGTGIDIDATGGNGGLSGAGVGTNGNAGLYNTSVMQAKGTTLAFEGGLYENSGSGVIQAIDGGTVALNGDSRILNGTLTSDATSSISAANTTQYLQSVTLSFGSQLNLTNDSLYVNTSLVNNGTITVANNSALLGETGATSFTGTGTIVLDDTANVARIYNGTITFGSGQTVEGSGQLGVNSAIFINNGVISGDVAGRNLDIDATGGNGGVSGAGVGTGGNSSLLNTGTIQATNGGTVTFEGGLYENSATGQLSASTGSNVNFGGDASLLNLQSGGVLDKGAYTSTTTGAQSTLNLQSNAANSITAIGTSGTGTDTVVTLSGANSVLQVTNFSGGPSTTIDSSLSDVAQTGELQLLNGRTLDIVANGGAFTNEGQVHLGGGTLGATTFANSGTTFGNGAITVAVNNSGTVNAIGGTLTTEAIIGSTGTVSTDATGTLSLGGASSAGVLVNDGHLALNTNNVTVTSDYQNANFGSGNAFTAHADVSGSGLILATSATMDLSGPNLSGNTLDVGNVRVGGSSSTTLTVTNNGSQTILRGAVQNTNASSVALNNANFVLNPNGVSSTATISYTGTTAGSLSGQSLNVVNNFDNVANKTVNLAGNVYQIAVAAPQPSTLTLAASRVGATASTGTVTIGNAAPNTAGYTESLSSTASVGSPFAVNGSGSATTTNLAAGSTQGLSISLGTGTSGSFSSTVAISNTSIPVTGSGFTPLALAGQSVTVSGKVYAPAVASLSSNTVDFGVVRQGSGTVSSGVNVTNAATGALTDNLNTSVGATPAEITVKTTPATLGEGQAGSLTFALNTATAGQVGGSASLGFTSTDADLAPLTLASQNVNFEGTVTELAKAELLMTGGAGAFSQSGSTYTLDLGTLAAGSSSTSTYFAALNDIVKSSYSEFLDGTFTGGTKGGFTFTASDFTGLAGGAEAGGDSLKFDTAGLAAGEYTDVITLDVASQYPGLSNEALGPITLDVKVDIAGGVVSGAPEPSTWAEMVFGVGILGMVLRRRRNHTAKLHMLA